MVRRKTKNRTGIPRIEGIPYHDAWISYTCINCGIRNYENIGKELLCPDHAYKGCRWTCSSCKFTHSRNADLPFSTWPEQATDQEGTPARRFWKAFFRSATEKPESYWKQCNVCSRILPNNDFSRHIGWGPLEKQIECRDCKAVINAELNPKRTSEQLREAASKRRIAELLIADSNEKPNVKDLFDRFQSRCFKTKIPLDIEKTATWQIDHTLPSRYFYPLSIENATLLSAEANQNKSDMWPSEFYTNTELTELARITGASLELLSSSEPVFNPNIDVNACVERYLNVRDQSNLLKRVKELKTLLEKHNLTVHLSDETARLLGLKRGH